MQTGAFEHDKKDESLSLHHFDFAMAFSAKYRHEVQSVLWFRASDDVFTDLFYNNPWKNAVKVPRLAEI